MTAPAATVAAVGMFDGVHRGHITVLNALRRYAASHSLKPEVYTFSRHPLAAIKPESSPPRLISNGERRHLIEAMGIAVNELDFEDVRHLSAAEFLGMLKERGVQALVMGFNNHIGRDRLTAAEADVLGIMPVVEAGVEPGLENVSSSNIRKALAGGDVAGACRMLGRPYELVGEVVAGNRIGRTIGYPTANITIPQFVTPANGVYAVDVAVPGAVGPLRGMANLGTRPTVGGTQRTFEVHIIDWQGNIYGQVLRVRFLERIRSEQRFESLEQLQRTLHSDALAAMKV